MRNRKFPALIALLVAFAAVTAGTASGQETTTDTTTYEVILVSGETLTNTRSIESVLSTQTLTTSGGSVDSALEVIVEEVEATGVNPWSVSTTIDDLTNADTSATIGREQVTLTPQAAVPVTADIDGALALDLTGSGVSASGGGQYTFLAGGTEATTLFEVAGQDSTKAYTGFYTGTGTLSTSFDGLFDVLIDTYDTTVTVTLVE